MVSYNYLFWRLEPIPFSLGTDLALTEIRWFTLSPVSLVIPNEHERGRIQHLAKLLAVLAADARMITNGRRFHPHSLNPTNGGACTSRKLQLISES